MTTTKEPAKAFALPEGRLINHSLFMRDKFDDAAKAKYNVELVFEPDALQGVEDRLAKAAVAEWGGSEDDYWEGKIGSPILDGDVLAQRRADKGKTGEAYAGKMVIRAATIYNRNGQEDAGGAEVYNTDVELIEPVNASEIYQGCYGVAGVKVGFYKDAKTQQNCLMFYLAAFQKTRDGERLVAESTHEELFKPVGRDSAEGGSKRRTRKG